MARLRALKVWEAHHHMMNQHLSRRKCFSGGQGHKHSEIDGASNVEKTSSVSSGCTRMKQMTETEKRLPRRARDIQCLNEAPVLGGPQHEPKFFSLFGVDSPQLAALSESPL
jgi:hypothetical protein